MKCYVAFDLMQTVYRPHTILLSTSRSAFTDALILEVPADLLPHLQVHARQEWCSGDARAIHRC